MGYFIQPEEWPDGQRMEGAAVLASFPWIYSAGETQPLVVLGVVNVWSLKPDTELLRLFDLPEDACVKAMEAMHDLVNLACGKLLIL